MLTTLSPAYRASRHFFCYTRCCSLHTTARCAMKKRKTHYDVLDVDFNATPEQIRAAYVKKSKQLHPDLNPNQPQTHEKFIRMTEAYNTLIKKNTRHKYDLSLRAYLRREKLHRSTYSGHTSASSSTRPGSSFHQPEADEHVYWDETIRSMRDKSKGKEFSDTDYYGVKGLKRQPNSYILAGVIVWIFIGVIIHFVIFSKSRDYTKYAHDAQDIKFHNLYMERRIKAKLHGNELQLQLLKDQYASQNGDQ